MDAIIVGIDVSKDRLDVAVRPTGETFVVSRDAEGLDALIAKLTPLISANSVCYAQVALTLLTLARRYVPPRLGLSALRRMCSACRILVSSSLNVA